MKQHVNKFLNRKNNLTYIFRIVILSLYYYQDYIKDKQFMRSSIERLREHTENVQHSY